MCFYKKVKTPLNHLLYFIRQEALMSFKYKNNTGETSKHDFNMVRPWVYMDNINVEDMCSAYGIEKLRYRACQNVCH